MNHVLSSFAEHAHRFAAVNVAVGFLALVGAVILVVGVLRDE
jgi:hypothetical protein